MFSAKVIQDSISGENQNVPRLRTFDLRYPRFVHAELLTHRVFSRNSSGSRAVPIEKLIEEARSDELRACPVHWGRNQKGMQANEELTGLALGQAKSEWRDAALRAADSAEFCLSIGGHKQWVNRMLEPFTHINTIVTATEFNNWFGLRLHPSAMPEAQHLANLMWDASKASMPRVLRRGEWHLPYIEALDWEDGHKIGFQNTNPHIPTDSFMEVALDVVKRVSVARCARISYRSFKTGRRSTVAEDYELYRDTLHLPNPGDAEYEPEEPIHASPSEHQATPDNCTVFNQGLKNSFLVWENGHQHGNLTGWVQFRKTLPGEAVAPLPLAYRNQMEVT